MGWLCGELQGSVGDVLTDREPHHMVPGVVRRNAAPSCADHNNEFGLIVGKVAVELDVVGGSGQTRWELCEDERAFGEIHVGFSGVPGVIQADGEDGSWAWDWWSENCAGDCTFWGSAVELDSVQFSVTVDGFHRVPRERPIRGRRKVVPVLAINEHGSAVEIPQSECHQKSLFRPGRSSATSDCACRSVRS